MKVFRDIAFFLVLILFGNLVNASSRYEADVTYSLYSQNRVHHQFGFLSATSPSGEVNWVGDLVGQGSLILEGLTPDGKNLLATFEATGGIVGAMVESESVVTKMKISVYRCLNPYGEWVVFNPKHDIRWQDGVEKIYVAEQISGSSLSGQLYTREEYEALFGQNFDGLDLGELIAGLDRTKYSQFIRCDLDIATNEVVTPISAGELAVGREEPIENRGRIGYDGQRIPHDTHDQQMVRLEIGPEGDSIHVGILRYSAEHYASVIGVGYGDALEPMVEETIVYRLESGEAGTDLSNLLEKVKRYADTIKYDYSNLLLELSEQEAERAEVRSRVRGYFQANGERLLAMRRDIDQELEGLDLYAQISANYYIGQMYEYVDSIERRLGTRMTLDQVVQVENY